ncbi:uncharacterized protein LOC101848199 [Aplysia californica]|uniref:Uncharacterized protein LOC101848199 n=1 Tax=Aplysia californica TaxID=6500 RepID=A0ABM0JMR4_APLCA|nr:uncharacterized protein LOC101848199 [Aplysia californica]
MWAKNAGVLLLLLLSGVAMGYAPHGGSDHSSHGHGGFGGSSHGFGGGSHGGHGMGVVSKRSDVTPNVPKPVQELYTKVKAVIQGIRKGTQNGTLKGIMEEIVAEAEKVLKLGNANVLKQDVESLISSVAVKFLHLLTGVTDNMLPPFEFALSVLDQLTDLLYQDTKDVYIAVAAIGETADYVERLYDLMRQIFHNVFAPGPVTTKRQTAVGGHVNTGPGGTTGGVHATHTWDHGGGSKTTVGGHVDHDFTHGGTSGGVSVSHTWRREMEDRRRRETTVGGHVETGPGGTSGGVHGSHTSGGTTVSGHIDHGPSGTSGGVSGSHTWRRSPQSRRELKLRN